jgi:hypothetical protein
LILVKNSRIAIEKTMSSQVTQQQQALAFQMNLLHESHYTSAAPKGLSREQSFRLYDNGEVYGYGPSGQAVRVLPKLSTVRPYPKEQVAQQAATYDLVFRDGRGSFTVLRGEEVLAMREQMSFLKKSKKN